MNIFERNAKKIVILAVIAGSTSGIFTRMITADSMAVGFFRLSIAVPFFAIPILLKHRQELRVLTAKDYFWCGLSGFFLFLHFFTWFTAVKTTTIASAVILGTLHPLVVLLVTVFIFRKKVSGKAVGGILIALLGGGIVAGSDYSALAGGAFYGNLMAFASAVFIGLYFCIGRVMRAKIPPGTYVMLVFFSCWCFFTLGMLATGTPFTGYPVMDYVWLVVMTLVCQIGSHAVYNWCFGYVTSLYVSAWGTSESIYAILLAAIIFSEIPTLWQCVGGLITLGGLLYYNINEGKNSE